MATNKKYCTGIYTLFAHHVPIGGILFLNSSTILVAGGDIETSSLISEASRITLTNKTAAQTSAAMEFTNSELYLIEQTSLLCHGAPRLALTSSCI